MLQLRVAHCDWERGRKPPTCPLLLDDISEAFCTLQPTTRILEHSRVPQNLGQPWHKTAYSWSTKSDRLLWTSIQLKYATLRLQKMKVNPRRHVYLASFYQSNKNTHQNQMLQNEDSVIMENRHFYWISKKRNHFRKCEYQGHLPYLKLSKK